MGSELWLGLVLFGHVGAISLVVRTRLASVSSSAERISVMRRAVAVWLVSLVAIGVAMLLAVVVATLVSVRREDASNTDLIWLLEYLVGAAVASASAMWLRASLVGIPPGPPDPASPEAPSGEDDR